MLHSELKMSKVKKSSAAALKRRQKTLEQLLTLKQQKKGTDSDDLFKEPKRKRSNAPSGKLYADLRQAPMRHYMVYSKAVTPEHGEHVRRTHDPSSPPMSDNAEKGPDIVEIKEKDVANTIIASNIMTVAKKMCDGGDQKDLYLITLDDSHVSAKGEKFNGIIGTSSVKDDSTKHVKVLPVDFSGDDDVMRRRELHGDMITSLSSMKGDSATGTSNPLEDNHDSAEHTQMGLLDRHPTLDALVTAAKQDQNYMETPDMSFSILKTQDLGKDHHSIPRRLHTTGHLLGEDGLPPGATVTTGPNGSVGYSVPQQAPQENNWLSGIGSIIGMVAPLLGMLI